MRRFSARLTPRPVGLMAAVAVIVIVPNLGVARRAAAYGGGQASGRLGGRRFPPTPASGTATQTTTPPTPTPSNTATPTPTNTPTLTPTPPSTPVPGNLSVNTSQVLSTVSSSPSGINEAIWDSHMRDSAVPGLVQAAGINVIRFPGGSYADTYHWQTNSPTAGTSPYYAKGNNFDSFMTQVVQPAGGQAMITVNYGSNVAGTDGGDPAEAAAWVAYAKSQGYNAPYWEIGNEVYGNGYYGTQWEVDMHCLENNSCGTRAGNPLLSPAEYAANVAQFAQQMKAADTSIKVGIVLDLPGNWPDTVKSVSVNGTSVPVQNWDATVLSQACQYADFGIIHWYPESPGKESDSGLLTSPANVVPKIQALRAEISQYCPHPLPIMVTESNSVSSTPGKQTTSIVNALFALEDEMTWLENGASSVEWWDQHNGAGCKNTAQNASLYGTLPYGDYGILSSGTSCSINGVTYTEPPLDTPFPTYYGLQMLAQVLTPGAKLIGTTSSVGGLVSFAALVSSGRLTLLLINASATTSTAVTPDIPGLSSSGGTVLSYGPDDALPISSALSTTGGNFTYQLAPYTAAVIQVNLSV